jgi:hypothetical protein
MATSIAPDGSEAVLYSFRGGSDGALPFGVVQGIDGALYGVLPDTGTPVKDLCNVGCGTIFRMTLTGDKSTFYTFGPEADGIQPSGYLTVGRDGTIYGTAGSGPDSNGVIYAVTPSGVELAPCAFAGGASSDSGSAPLVQTSDGTIYGLGAGGTFSAGTVYSMSTSCVESIVWSFGGDYVN